jgi:hypothetical protein
MRDPGELITKTLVREFAEEALDYQLKYDKNNRINTKAGDLELKLHNFFRNGTQVNINSEQKFSLNLIK